MYKIIPRPMDLRALCPLHFAYDISNTTSMTYKMKDKVDIDIMRKAVKKTMERYPYLKQSFVVTDNDYYFVENNKDIVVFDSDVFPTLNDVETNNNLIAFAAKDEFIYFHSFHDLMDGIGLVKVLKTFFYYYLSDKYKVDLKVNDLITDKTPMTENEWKDFMDREPFKLDNPIEKKIVLDDAYDLVKEGFYKTKAESTVTLVRLDANKFLQYVKKNESKPFAILCCMFGEVFNRLHRDNNKRYVFLGLSTFRKQLGAEESHRPLLQYIYFDFENKNKNASIKEKSAPILDQLAYYKSDGFCKSLINTTIDYGRRINELKTMSEKMQLSDEFDKKTFHRKSTISLSYVGKSDYGDMEKYFEWMQTNSTYGDVPMCVEVDAITDYFFLSIGKHYAEDIYVDELVKYLNELGLDAIVVNKEKLREARVKYK